MKQSVTTTALSFLVVCGTPAPILVLQAIARTPTSAALLLYYFLRRRHKLGYLGVYIAYSAPDVGFEHPTPVVVLDTPDIVQCFFLGVAYGVDSSK